jgi:type IV pilus assembly protein PilM
MMMRNILLPEKIGTRRLFALRVLSIMIQEDSVRGSIVLLKPNVSVVQKLLDFPFGQSSNDAPASSLQEALTDLIAAAGKVDDIRVVIAATMTIIKEFEVPFVDNEKIRMVIGYEIETLLPFSLEEAIVDFIVTKRNKDLQSSQILAVAIRKQDLAAILEPYEQNGIKVKTVIIDLFATYGLYQKISTYHDLPGSTALVDVGLQGTRITFLQNNQLKLTRYITKGLNFILNQISEEIGSSKEEILKHLQEDGIKALDTQSILEKTIQKYLINFFNEIQFTLNSFSLKLNYYEGVSKILFVGSIANIPHLMKFSTELLQIPCELFDPQKIFENKGIKNNTPTSTIGWELFVNLLGATLGPIEFEDFNLRKNEFALFDIDLGLRQLFVCCFLLLLSFGVIGFVSYSQISELRSTARALEHDQADRLRALLPRKDRARTITLQALFRKIEDLVKEKKSLWEPFGQTRIKPLELLLEVTQTFDKNQFKLDIEEFNLSEKEPGNPVIELEGYFKSDLGMGSNFKEWMQLEERIKESPLLTLVEPPSTIPAAEKGIKFEVKLQKKSFRYDAQSVNQ